jgi:hypothetical protein
MILLCGALAGLGGALLVAWAFPGQPALADALGRLDPDSVVGGASPDAVGGGPTDRVGRWALHRVPLRWLAVPRTDLQLLGMTPHAYVGQRVAYALIGLLFPLLFAAAGGLLSLLVPVITPPLGLSLLGCLVLGVALSFIPVAEVRRKAAAARVEFTRATASYIDLVALARRGGAGTSEALHTAAEVGDSWPFERIRQVVTRADWAGQSPWEALGALGDEVAVPALSDLGDIMRVAGSEGVGVQDALRARAAAVRNQLLADDLAAANAASETLALPVAGLGLAFVALLATPALLRIVGGM